MSASEMQRKAYTVRHFRELCPESKDVPEDAVLVPIIEVLWRAIEAELQKKELALFGVSDAFFLEQGGHRGRGQWMCVVDGLLVRLTPQSTDMDVVTTGGSIYMVWRIEAEGELQRVNALLIRIASFIKKHLSARKFRVLKEDATALVRKHRPDVLSKHVKHFYGIAG